MNDRIREEKLKQFITSTGGLGHCRPLSANSRKFKFMFIHELDFRKKCSPQFVNIIIFQNSVGIGGKKTKEMFMILDDSELHFIPSQMIYFRPFE